MSHHIPVGLAPNENLIGQAEESTPDGMRAAIYRGSLASALIRSMLMQADIRGLNGEDKYTLLAYQALVALESTHRRLMEYIERTPAPPLVFKP